MLNKIGKLLKNSSVTYTIMAVISSGINFITLIIFGKIFSVDDYGTITTFQALIANVAVLVSPLQIMICKTIVEDSDNKEDTMTSIVSFFLLINVLVILIMGLAGGGISNYLHLPKVFEYIAYIMLVMSNNIYTALNGVLQGKQNFRLLGYTNLILYCVKLAIGVLLGILGMGPLAVIIGFLFAEITCIFITLLWMKKSVRNEKRKFRFHIRADFIKWFGWSFALYLIVSLYMNNGDLLLGNIYCSQTEIGLYSVAISLAKISVFLIATPIAVIILPKVTACQGNVAEQHKLLFYAESVTLIVSLLYGVCFIVLGKWIITFLYGSEYAGAGEYVIQCTMFSVILGLFFVFYQYAFATDLMNSFTIITFTLGVIEFMFMYIFKISMNIIPIVMSIGMVLSMVITMFRYMFKNRSKRILEN